MKTVTTEMQVDTVGSMSKTGAKCVLKGEKEINGYMAKFTLTVTCTEIDLFEEMEIRNEDDLIDMVLKAPAQTRLPVEDDEV